MSSPLWIGRWHRILESLAEMTGFRPRRLRRRDQAAAAFSRSQGVRGVYVENALASGEFDGWAFERAGELACIAWFGPRGNLVVVCDPSAAGHEEAVIAQIMASGSSWRIALGDAVIVDALRLRMQRSVLAHRDQVYYAGRAEDATSALVRGDVRAPAAADRERLARATLALNASDLNIAPERVDRRWLYRTIDERCRDGSTRVIGPPGDVWCKVDFGSCGAGGAVLEGVYTFPEHRGRGYAASLVASLLAAADGETSLHVADHNVAARRAYEAAGMRAAGRCRLLLLG